MDLPDAAKLREVLTACRDAGVYTLKLGALEVTFSPPSPVDEINKLHPLPADPQELIRRSLQGGLGGSPDAASGIGRPDVLDVLANGGRLVDTQAGMPTAGQ
jgi:hypothetical protein